MYSHCMCYMKVKFLFILAAALLTVSCGRRIDDARMDKREKNLRKISVQQYKSLQQIHNGWDVSFEKYFSTLSIEERVCQLFIENLEGDTVFVPIERIGELNGEKKTGRAMIPGGYLFFSYNLANTPEGIMKFTDSIKNYCRQNRYVPPFLAVDQEGGFVNRLKIVGGPLPSCQRVASKLNIGQAYKYYVTQARQMKSLGFDMNLAPVVEICTPENEKFLDGRSFGSSFQVRSYGTACVNAYENRGISAVIKHFPGNTNTDPHTGLPEIRKPYDDLKLDIQTFGQIIHCEPDGLLMSHARTSSVDPGVPACFSKKWVTETLRQDLKFNGIVFSDDIFMGALADNGYPPEEACVKAIEAGVDCIMISEKRFAGPAASLIKKASEDPEFEVLINRACRKILWYKINKGILAAEYEEVPFDVRLEEFKQARQENIDMYLEYFD